jgi:hypothetical protein
VRRRGHARVCSEPFPGRQRSRLRLRPEFAASGGARCNIGERNIGERNIGERIMKEKKREGDSAF